MPKTHGFRRFRKAFRIAQIADKQKGSSVEEVLDKLTYQKSISRRKALKALGVIGALTMSAACKKDQVPQPEENPEVAIIGGGLAGLSAAYYLKQRGLTATVYEAANRFGGRTFTMENVLSNGLSYEAGGEFINTNHEHLLDLIAEFGIETVDTEIPQETPFLEGYHFGGAEVTMAQLAAALEPFIPLFEADYEAVDDDFDTAAPLLDAMSCTEYFDAKGVDGFLRKLLDIIITGEFGLEPDYVSALSFIYQLPFVDGDTVEVLGEEGDERFKFKNGSIELIKALENDLAGRLVSGAALRAVNQNESGQYILNFDGRSEATADIVLLGVPIGVLREIELNIDLPDTLTQYIREAGLGSNSKVVVEYQDKPWRALSFNGNAYSDEGFQTCWDTTRLLDGASALTYFLGGLEGQNITDANLSAKSNQYTNSLDKLFTGLAAVQTNNHWAHNWLDNPFSKCSYACFKPSQYTNAIDHFYIESDDPEEQQNVFEGNLGFIGEAFSDEYQGFMNGAVQTAYLAAAYIANELIG